MKLELSEKEVRTILFLLQTEMSRLDNLVFKSSLAVKKNYTLKSVMEHRGVEEKCKKRRLELMSIEKSLTELYKQIDFISYVDEKF